MNVVCFEWSVMNGLFWTGLFRTDTSQNLCSVSWVTIFNKVSHWLRAAVSSTVVMEYIESSAIKTTNSSLLGKAHGRTLVVLKPNESQAMLRALLQTILLLF